MEDQKKLKTIFSVDAVSIISDTNDDKTGEASVGYNYTLDGGLPELAFALAGFLKEVDKDEDIKQAMSNGDKIGPAFITLLQQYYNNPEEPDK